MKGTRILLQTQLQMLKNVSGRMDFPTSLRMVLFSTILWIFLFGSYRFYDLVFRFMERNKPLGPVLNEKLVGVALLGCLMILLFSNVITSLSVMYLSRDVRMLFMYPLHPFQIFLPKFIKSVLVGSWTVLCLLLPMCAAFGHARNAGFTFYFFGALAVIPYVLIAAGLGTAITMLLTRFLPARRSKTLVVLAFIAVIIAAFTWIHASGIVRMTNTQALSVVDDYMYVKLGMIWYLPSYWMSQALQGLTLGLPEKWIFFVVLLFSTAAVSVCPALWFGMDRRIYYAGWSLTQEASGQESPISLWSRLRRILGASEDSAALSWLRPSTRALIAKDLKMFCRDTTQWAQFLVLVALVVVYFANTRNMPIDIEDPFWKNVMGFINLAMTGFVLATLAIRFFFPLVSLEGRSFWLIGVAPVSRRRFLWAKVWPSLILSSVLGVCLVALSNRSLKIDSVLGTLNVCTSLSMAITMTCLCLGLGARFPQFNVQSAAEIASGAGGIVTMVLGLIYVGGVITLEAGPMQQYLSSQAGFSWFLDPWIRLCLLGVLLWSSLFAAIPLWLGIRSLSTRDF